MSVSLRPAPSASAATPTGLTVRVEVADGNRLRPSVRRAGDHDEGGRGTFLIDALASAWGVTETSGSKLVWFEVPA